MLKDDDFIFNVYKSFIILGKPKLSTLEQLNLRSRLFSTKSFLSMKLEDRKHILSSIVSDRVLESFLVYLYNRECDEMKLDRSLLIYENKTGNYDEIFEIVITKALEYEYSEIAALKYLTKMVKKSIHIGYEKYICDIKKFALYKLISRRKIRLESALKYFNKTEDTWIFNGKYDKTIAVLNALQNIFNTCRSYDLSIKLMVELLSANIFFYDKALTYTQNNDIYISNTFPKRLYTVMLLHEASHMLYNYEARYSDFKNAYLLDGYTEKELFEAWHSAKEDVINQRITLLTDHPRFERYITKPNIPITSTIIDSALLKLKHQTKKKEKGDFIWK